MITLKSLKIFFEDKNKIDLLKEQKYLYEFINSSGKKYH